MRRTRGWLWGSCSLWAICTFSQSAHASSTFETGPGEAIKAQAQLDFTIVIPSVVTIKSHAVDHAPMAERQALSVAGDRSSEPEAFLAKANGGTLTITPQVYDDRRHQTLAANGDGAAARTNSVYLVAMP